MIDGIGALFRRTWEAPTQHLHAFYLAACFIAVVASPAISQTSPPLPAYLTLPAQMSAKGKIVIEDYGQAEFPLSNHHDVSVQNGRHWHVNFTISGFPHNTPSKAVWVEIRPALAQSGWTFPAEMDLNPFMATIRYQKSGRDTWAVINVFSSDDIRADIVEVGPPAMKLMLKPPATAPETISPQSGDFPYLSPLPGSQPGHGSHIDGPMLVPASQDSHELQAVGSGRLRKDYTGPAVISTLLFVTVYRDALTKAGWSVVHQSQGIHQGDATMTAHYAANGRDIWANLHNLGNDYQIEVADAGAEDLGSELDRDCHVALYGVHFDFNKATLRPDSEPVLEKVLALLKARADLKLEVQGHTDNVGGDEFNQKLSEARADTVSAWLRAKGVTAARLTAHGYGMRQPVADNGSEAGRAKNRRVELKNQACGN
jgi:outer membrane protein OmpA-like peptidoglycan-associated protein